MPAANPTEAIFVLQLRTEYSLPSTNIISLEQTKGNHDFSVAPKAACAMVGRYVYFAEKCRRSIPAESTSTVTPFRNRHGRVYRTTEELPHLAGESSICSSAVFVPFLVLSGIEYSQAVRAYSVTEFRFGMGLKKSF